MPYKYTYETIPDWVIKEIDLAQYYYKTQSELAKKYNISERTIFLLRKNGKIDNVSRKKTRLRGFAKCCAKKDNTLIKTLRFEDAHKLKSRIYPSLIKSIAPKMLDKIYISVIFDEN